MIVHSSITLTSAKPGAHSMIKFKMSLTFSRTFSKEKIPVRLLPKPELSGTIFRNIPKFWNNVPEISGLGKKGFGNHSEIQHFQNLFHNGNNFQIISVRKPLPGINSSGNPTQEPKNLDLMIS